MGDASDYTHTMQEFPHHDNIAEEEPWLAVATADHLSDGTAAVTRSRVRLWALVLDARGIPCMIAHENGSWQLMVPAFRQQEAQEQLSRFEAENINWPPLPILASPTAASRLATLSILLLLAAFYNITTLGLGVLDGFPVDWLAAGGVQAARIQDDGQWWRLVTALTLHADLAHLSGNLAFGGVFVYLLCREVGSGAAWSLALASGALGNLLNSLLQPATHQSIGASTAVFGIVGALAVRGVIRHRRYLRYRWLLPAGGALALLTVLGTEGKHTDIGAHLFGFLAGAIIGLGMELLAIRYGQPGRRLSLLLGCASALTVIGCWYLALQPA